MAFIEPMHRNKPNITYLLTGVQAGGAGASHNACLHIDSLSFDDVIIFLTVFEMLLCSVF